jgi:hypothetical protein
VHISTERGWRKQERELDGCSQRKASLQQYPWHSDVNVFNTTELCTYDGQSAQFYVMYILPQLQFLENDRKRAAKVKATFIQFSCNHIA